MSDVLVTYIVNVASVGNVVVWSVTRGTGTKVLLMSCVYLVKYYTLPSFCGLVLL